MSAQVDTYRKGFPSLPFAFLSILLIILFAAGGASRPDAAGQIVVRATAWIILVAAILSGMRPDLTRYRPIAYVMLAMIGLLVVQLVPLPPGLWQTLPGRDVFAQAAIVSGQDQPWRPLSVAPDLTLNALASLIVPLTVLVLVAALTPRERSWLPGLLIVLSLTAALIGLVEFAGRGFDNPLINRSQWRVSGNFANRNHYALLLAMGCLIAPVWAVSGRVASKSRLPIALLLTILFSLTLLASGSRAGILALSLALLLALAIVRQPIWQMLSRGPRWALPAVISGVVTTIVLVSLLSMWSGRAVSIDRALTLDVGQDFRAQALPTVWGMLGTYFPVGSGFGSFEPLFRMAEPFDLLKRTYFNHAHNDFMEILIDGGIPAAVILVGAIGWWAAASVRAWRTGTQAMLPRLGSSLLLLVLIASVFDYPARTPAIMAMIVIAATWLCSVETVGSRQALPDNGRDL